MTKRQKEDSTLKSYLFVYFCREGFLTCSMFFSITPECCHSSIEGEFDILVWNCVFVSVCRCIYTCINVLVHTRMHVHTHMHV